MKQSDARVFLHLVVCTVSQKHVNSIKNPLYSMFNNRHYHKDNIRKKASRGIRLKSEPIFFWVTAGL